MKEQEITPELMAQAEKTESVQELIALAVENGVELDEEQAQIWFGRFHGNTGELSDEELANVSGGGCYTADGYLKTTIGYKCEYYEEDPKADMGVKGTCFCCKYWDAKGASQMICFGQPGICRNPKQKRKG